MKIIAGNFKSNNTRGGTIEYLQKLDSALESQNLNAESKNSPSLAEFESTYSPSLAEGARGCVNSTAKNRRIYIFPATTALVDNSFKNLTLGAQNAHFAEGGAFTGEISLCHLSEFHIKTILIGHSERRTLFGESDEVVAKKFAFFAEQNFEIFLCVGENLAIRQSNKTKDFLRSQLKKIDLDYPNLIIAYEPIWAIGTGQNASLEQISEVYEFLQSIAKKPILYGGSVNANNAKEIISATDGVLVGGASLEVEHFYQIIRS